MNKNFQARIHYNNFDFLRLLFAVFVIITHAYPLTGLPEKDPLVQLTGIISFSYLGVAGFFSISGFLIYQSLSRSINVLDYFKKRILRIFPGLLIMLILIFILAPFAYQGGAYFYNRSAWTFIPNNLLLFTLQTDIKGVFENNPFKEVVNGSLWTIPYEFLLYIILSFLFLIKNKRLQGLIVIGTFCIVLIIHSFFYFIVIGKSIIEPVLRIEQLLKFSGFFFGGAFLAVIDVKSYLIENRRKVLVAMIFLIVVSIKSGLFLKMQFITIPTTVILFGIMSTPFIKHLGEKIGDLSYGVYIYAFPVQQALEHFFQINYVYNMLFTLVIVLPLAYLSWHLVEKKALQLIVRSKPKLAQSALVQG